ncbi:hypothetical protein WME90_08145 [Sorangium sp. So ce375]|uniref:hypothetical protein n=1 Tax=Sorangium sp. So ce375 TaxID=3133306 RepID=UPI003F5C53B1
MERARLDGFTLHAATRAGALSCTYQQECGTGRSCTFRFDEAASDAGRYEFLCDGDRGTKEAGELLSDGGSAAECKTANVICQGGSCSDATLPRNCTWLCRNDGDCTAAAPHCLPQTLGATTMNVCRR